MSRILKAMMLAVSLMCSSVWAGDSTATSARASMEISNGSAAIVSGSLGLISAGGQLVVTAVERTADGVSVVLRGASDASGASVRVSADVAAAAFLAAGTVLEASATGVGYLLQASGKVIAFVPNEIGLSLLHHSGYER